MRDNKELYIYYKSISNFPFINSEYIFDIYNKYKNKCQNKNYIDFLKFLKYFRNTYLIDYDPKYWNYYENIIHITNNASESYNNYLKNKFPKKPTFTQLIQKLQNEESLSFDDYERRIAGIWYKKKKSR